MIIRFRIQHKTNEDVQMYVSGSSPVLGRYNPDNALKLKLIDDTWCADVQIDTGKERLLFYKYFYIDSSNTITYEVGGGRRLALNSATVSICTQDEWQNNNAEAPFLTDPFSHVYYGARFSPYTQTHLNTHEFIIRAVIHSIPRDCRIVLLGSSKELGEWKPEKAVKMARLKGLKWVASFNIAGRAGETWQYKFALVKEASGEIFYENEVHTVTLPDVARQETFIHEHAQIKIESPLINPHPKYAGCTVPLFSLRSQNSYGIGEILDLKLLIDWAKQSGMKIVNILPINDTTQFFGRKDSSPYNCISSMALNPIYISLDALGPLENKELAKEAEQERRSLNRRATVDWDDVYAFKMKYLRAMFAQSQEGTFARPDFYKYFKENKEWLGAYAVFCSLRDKYKSADFHRWGEHQNYSQEFTDAVVNKKHQDKSIVENAWFYIWTQYLLHNQMAQAMSHAHANGIALKGEYSMNISQNSLDAWRFPYYFDFDTRAAEKTNRKDGLAKINSIIKASQTGCSANIYNWEEMEKDSYRWWKFKLRGMSEYFDVYSIGRIGQTCEDSNNQQITKLLPQLVATSNMLACGKYSQTTTDTADYKPQNTAKGQSELARESEIIMRSASIRQTMERLNILSLEVPETNADNTGTEALNNVAKGKSYFSIITTSTCNSQTLRMWLGQLRQSLSFTSEDTGLTYYDATAQECEETIKETLAAASMFAVFPLQDWMSIDEKLRNRFTDSERINNPQVNGWIWKYRMHLSLEQLLKADSLNRKIATLIAASGR